MGVVSLSVLFLVYSPVSVVTLSSRSLSICWSRGSLRIVLNWILIVLSCASSVWWYRSTMPCDWWLYCGAVCMFTRDA
eukprot:6492171-Amphidinium_carterae.2